MRVTCHAEEHVAMPCLTDWPVLEQPRSLLLGHLLTHPRFRKMSKKLLKPGAGSKEVDDVTWLRHSALRAQKSTDVRAR